MVREEFISKLVQRLDRLHAETDSEQSKNHQARKTNLELKQSPDGSPRLPGPLEPVCTELGAHHDEFHDETPCTAGGGRSLIAPASPTALLCPFLSLGGSLLEGKKGEQQLELDMSGVFSFTGTAAQSAFFFSHSKIIGERK